MVAALLANPNFLSFHYSCTAAPRLPPDMSTPIRLLLPPSFHGCLRPRLLLPPPFHGNVPKFPRVNVWDPYKRLGISPYAAEDEIWSSRNFLVGQYARDERSVESIEGAFEKLLMRSFWERKRTKINLKTSLKKKVEESPPWFKNLLNFVELPATVIILRRLFLFAFMACWSIMNSAEGGPAFKVAISLGACIYFLNDKTKSLGRAAHHWIWIPCGWLAMWFLSWSDGTSSYFTANMESRTSNVFTGVCFFVPWLYLSQIKHTNFTIEDTDFTIEDFKSSCLVGDDVSKFMFHLMVIFI